MQIMKLISKFAKLPMNEKPLEEVSFRKAKDSADLQRRASENLTQELKNLERLLTKAGGV